MTHQIGGTHYSSMKIEPGDYAHQNGLGFWGGSAIKYISRHRLKGGEQDLRKAIHCLEKLIKAEYHDNRTLETCT